MGVLQSIILSLGSSRVDFLKTIPYKESSQIGKHSGSRIGYTTTPHTQQLCNKTTFPDLGNLHFKTVNITYTCVEDFATGC
jgi:hypothetical protein